MMLFPFLLLSRPTGVRLFSSTVRYSSNRAIVYSQNGDPAKVLRVLTYPSLSPPPPGSVNIKFLLSPINPADINVIEGIYPSKPAEIDILSHEGQSLVIGGNEGLAQVTAVGAGVNSLRVDDRVVMIKQQAGTWATDRNVAIHDVAKIPDVHTLTESQAATMTVNPPTAYNMLSEFIDLCPGDFVIQNGANSAVGQAVIQIAFARGLKTINLIRDRPNLEQTTEKLLSLGATHVLTYDQLSDQRTRDQIKNWTNGKGIRLGLNCVGGRETTMMARLLNYGAYLVSYGGMAKQPLSLPVSLFIFKNLTCQGFWQSHWYKQKTPAEQEKLMHILVNLMKEQKLQTPDHEILKISAQETDSQGTEKIQNAMQAMAGGRYGKKILLRLESI